jgi:predicted DNA-binding protein
MANESGESNLCVRISEELLQRINRVAKALGKSQTQFVRDLLDEKTKPHKLDVDEIAKREEKIIARERSQ